MTDLEPRGPGRRRPRRLRRTEALRELVAETRLDARQLVMPHFVLPAESGVEPIAALPGISRLGRDELISRVEKDLALGLRSVLLFGLCAESARTEDGAASAREDAAVPAALRALRSAFGDEVVLITDVCLCAYTDHGHCGVLAEDGTVDNDRSLPPLAEMARAHADAGADIVAPSDMMDGRVGFLRDALDGSGFDRVAILSYAVKIASAFYGPFRDAASSAPRHGDRRGYQLDVRNRQDAIREARLDEEEGADLLMVKPALPCLDLLRDVRESTQLPLAAYNVSGEYAALKAAAERGWLDEASAVREALLAMRRAGAEIIVTYHARDALEKGWLSR